MGTEKKSFAERVPGGPFADGLSLLQAGASPDTVQLLCDVSTIDSAVAAMNAAVAKREAALHGLIDEMLALTEKGEWLDVFADAEGNPVEELFAHQLRRLVEKRLGPDAVEYIDASIACGLAWDLGVWQELVRELLTMNDFLTESRLEERKTLAPFLRARGLHEAEPYDDIIARLRRALAGGIRLITRTGGSSFPEFKEMAAAFDETAKNEIRLEVKRQYAETSRAALALADNDSLIDEFQKRFQNRTPIAVREKLKNPQCEREGCKLKPPSPAYRFCGLHETVRGLVEEACRMANMTTDADEKYAWHVVETQSGPRRFTSRGLADILLLRDGVTSSAPTL